MQLSSRAKFILQAEIAIVALLVGGLFLFIAYMRVPLVGHDFHYLFPYFLAGSWHIAHQGFLPHFYSPYICAGAPVYANPHDFSYSVLQILGLITDPRTAILITIILCAFLGFIGWYAFARDVLRVRHHFSLLFGSAILLNGFYAFHLFVAHYWMLSFFATGWILWMIFKDEKNELRGILMRAGLFGILISATLHMMGFLALLYIFFFLIFALPFYIVLMRILHKPVLSFFLIRWPAYLFAALLLSASKLVAIWSYMQNFPRTSDFETHTKVYAFIFEAFFPYLSSTQLLYGWGWHENTIAISPIVPLGMFLSAFFISSAINFARRHPINGIQMILAVCIPLWIVFSLLKGMGFPAERLQELPLLSSLRVSSRFLFLLIIAFSCASIVSLEHLWRRHRLRLTGCFTYISIFITISILLFTFHIALPNIRTGGDYEQYRTEWKDFNQNGSAHKSVSAIENDTIYRCPDPLLEWGGLKNKTLVNPESVFYESNYTLNMVNPACYVFPKENNCEPFDLFSMDQSDALNAFVSGEQNWSKMSLLQIAAFRISFISLCLALAIISIVSLRAGFLLYSQHNANSKYRE